jgi:hypothetical protein
LGEAKKDLRILRKRCMVRQESETDGLRQRLRNPLTGAG